MDLLQRTIDLDRSWRPGLPAYFYLAPWMLFVAVVCLPLLELTSPAMHTIAWVLIVAVVLVIAYRTAMTASVVFFYDDDGVWCFSGVLPWNKGVYGVKWRDIESVAFTQGFFAWVTRSYPVVVVERYTQRGEMRMPHLFHGNEAVGEINNRLMDMIRSAAPQAGG